MTAKTRHRLNGLEPDNLLAFLALLGLLRALQKDGNYMGVRVRGLSITHLFDRYSTLTLPRPKPTLWAPSHAVSGFWRPKSTLASARISESRVTKAPTCSVTPEIRRVQVSGRHGSAVPPS